MYRAYLLDLWLFMRKVALSALAILLTLLGSAALLYSADAWPDATPLDCLVRAFSIMSLEAVELPQAWHLEILIFVLPALAILFAAQGLVGATVLFLSKSQRQGEWNAVVAATHAGHNVICGLGQLGSTLCDGLVDAGRQVAVVDVNQSLASVVTARRRGIPVIIGDMTLAEAHIPKAVCALACSGDDLANLETAIAARQMNSTATVYVSVFKRSLADGISAALRCNIVTFSPYATAAEAILTQTNAAADSPSEQR